MLRKLAFGLLTFTALSSTGQDFIIKHNTCSLIGMIQEKTSMPDIYLVLEKELKIKKFNITYVTQQHKFKKGDLILTLEKEILGSGLFPPCFVVIHIKEEGVEKDFFSAGTKRAFPRRFRGSNYLCMLAVRDVLFHLPFCRKP
ncbi:MAG: hypothetical protein ACHQYQ_03430 [Bacteriovoracales bacterium]